MLFNNSATACDKGRRIFVTDSKDSVANRCDRVALCQVDVFSSPLTRKRGETGSLSLAVTTPPSLICKNTNTNTTPFAPTTVRNSLGAFERLVIDQQHCDDHGDRDVGVRRDHTTLSTSFSASQSPRVVLLPSSKVAGILQRERAAAVDTHRLAFLVLAEVKHWFVGLLIERLKDDYVMSREEVLRVISRFVDEMKGLLASVSGSSFSIVAAQNGVVSADGATMALGADVANRFGLFCPPLMTQNRRTATPATTSGAPLANQREGAGGSIIASARSPHFSPPPPVSAFIPHSSFLQLLFNVRVSQKEISRLVEKASFSSSSQNSSRVCNETFAHQKSTPARCHHHHHTLPLSIVASHFLNMKTLGDKASLLLFEPQVFEKAVAYCGALERRGCGDGDSEKGAKRRGAGGEWEGGDDHNRNTSDSAVATNAALPSFASSSVNTVVSGLFASLRYYATNGSFPTSPADVSNATCILSPSLQDLLGSAASTTASASVASQSAASLSRGGFLSPSTTKASFSFTSPSHRTSFSPSAGDAALISSASGGVRVSQSTMWTSQQTRLILLGYKRREIARLKQLYEHRTATAKSMAAKQRWALLRRVLWEGVVGRKPPPPPPSASSTTRPLGGSTAGERGEDVDAAANGMTTLDRRTEGAASRGGQPSASSSSRPASFIINSAFITDPTPNQAHSSGGEGARGSDNHADQTDRLVLDLPLSIRTQRELMQSECAFFKSKWTSIVPSFTPSSQASYPSFSSSSTRIAPTYTSGADGGRCEVCDGLVSAHRFVLEPIQWYQRRAVVEHANNNNSQKKGASSSRSMPGGLVDGAKPSTSPRTLTRDRFSGSRLFSSSPTTTTTTAAAPSGPLSSLDGVVSSPWALPLATVAEGSPPLRQIAACDDGDADVIAGGGGGGGAGGRRRSNTSPIVARNSPTYHDGAAGVIMKGKAEEEGAAFSSPHTPPSRRRGLSLTSATPPLQQQRHYEYQSQQSQQHLSPSTRRFVKEMDAAGKQEEATAMHFVKALDLHKRRHADDVAQQQQHAMLRAMGRDAAVAAADAVPPTRTSSPRDHRHKSYIRYDPTHFASPFSDRHRRDGLMRLAASKVDTEDGGGGGGGLGGGGSTPQTRGGADASAKHLPPDSTTRPRASSSSSSPRWRIIGGQCCRFGISARAEYGDDVPLPPVVSEAKKKSSSRSSTTTTSSPSTAHRLASHRHAACDNFLPKWGQNYICTNCYAAEDEHEYLIALKQQSAQLRRQHKQQLSQQERLRDRIYSPLLPWANVLKYLPLKDLVAFTAVSHFMRSAAMPLLKATLTEIRSYCPVEWRHAVAVVSEGIQRALLDPTCHVSAAAAAAAVSNNLKSRVSSPTANSAASGLNFSSVMAASPSSLTSPAQAMASFPQSARNANARLAEKLQALLNACCSILQHHSRASQPPLDLHSHSPSLPSTSTNLFKSAEALSASPLPPSTSLLSPTSPLSSRITTVVRRLQSEDLTEEVVGLLRDALADIEAWRGGFRERFMEETWGGVQQRNDGEKERRRRAALNVSPLPENGGGGGGGGGGGIGLKRDANIDAVRKKMEMLRQNRAFSASVSPSLTKNAVKGGAGGEVGKNDAQQQVAMAESALQSLYPYGLVNPLLVTFLQFFIMLEKERRAKLFAERYLLAVEMRERGW